MKTIVSKENTPSGPELKFLCVIGSKIRRACASKHTQKIIIGFLLEEACVGSFICNDSRWKPVYKMNGSAKRIIPKF